MVARTKSTTLALTPQTLVHSLPAQNVRKEFRPNNKEKNRIDTPSSFTNSELDGWMVVGCGS